MNKLIAVLCLVLGSMSFAMAEKVEQPSRSTEFWVTINDTNHGPIVLGPYDEFRFEHDPANEVLFLKARLGGGRFARIIDYGVDCLPSEGHDGPKGWSQHGFSYPGGYCSPTLEIDE